MKHFLLFSLALEFCILNSYAFEKQNSNDSIFIFFLKDTLTNTSLSKLIDYNKSNESVIILYEKDDEYYAEAFKKDVERKDSVIKATKWGLPPQAASINNMNCYYKISNDEIQYQYGNADYPQKSKYTIEVIKKQLAPTKQGITLFYIHNIPCGLWALKDGILFKVLFKKSKAYLIDGNRFFSEKIIPKSPNGIERVLNGESFFPYVVK